jgi:hypothetical protein
MTLLAGLSDDNNHTTPNEQVDDPTLATVAPTTDFIRNIDPCNVNNIDQARQPTPLDLDDIADFTTLTILRQAVADDSKLQIIFATIELQAVALATARRHPLQSLLHPSNFSIAKRSAGIPATITNGSTAPSSRPSHDDILADNTRPQCFSVSRATQAPMAIGHRLANHEDLHQ